MLCLSRKRNEEILIGGGITITVLRIDRDTVRLGITAPTSTPVDRREIHDAKMADLHAHDLGGESGVA